MVEKDVRQKVLKILFIVLSVYFFLLSINLMGHAFKLFGKGFAQAMLTMTSDPLAGLIIGIVATSIIQSSSTTTSLVVGMVAGGALTISSAIPIIMGANIGTTITNTLVSMGHISNRNEFRRAFSAGIVHDFFNILSVLVLFPLELKFHLIEKIALKLEKSFTGVGGLTLFNPLKQILEPVLEGLDWLFQFLPFQNVMMLIFSVIVLFVSLYFLIRTIRSLVLDKLEIIINEYLFRNDLIGFLFGIILTFIVQSSSVTTSLIVPLAGAGVINLRQIYPYTLGANIGTTGTAILAALATQNHLAVTVAFAHLCFNILGILIFYPLKFIPVQLAGYIGRKASESRRNLIVFISAYLLLYFLPVLLIIL